MKVTPARLALFPLFFIIYEFAGNLSNDMYLPAFLQIAKDLSTSHRFVQISITTWLLGVSLAQILLGPLTDRFGRRPILFGGGVIFLISTGICAIASSAWELVFVRFFQGLGVGSIMIAGYSSIHDLYDDHRATLILVWTSTVAVVTPQIAPLFGSYILLFSGWRTIFWIIFGLALAALVTLMLIVPESLKRENRHSLHPIAIAKTYGKLFSTRRYLLQTLTYSLQCSGMIIWITASPILIMDHYHYSPYIFGYLQIVIFAGFIIGAQSVRFFLKVLSRTKLVYIGLLVSIFGAILMFFFALFFNTTLYGILGAMSIYALGYGMNGAPLGRELLIATNVTRGMALALFLLLMTATGSLVSLVVSLLSDTPLIISLLLCGVISIATIGYICKGERKLPLE